MEFFKLCVELVKAIAWPAAVFGLGFMFRADFRSLFPRLTKAGATGFEFDPGKQLLIAAFRGELKDLPGLPRTPTIAALETQLHTELELLDPEKRTDLLIRHLAQARLSVRFEQVYRLIFGSQISGLRALDTAAGGAASRAEAVAFFDSVKLKHPDFYEKNIFEEWIRFPIGAGLMEERGSDFAITEYGRDFLKYLTATKLPEDKAW